MLRSFVIICCFVFCAVTLRAQTVFSGRVLENKTRITLRGVIVKNLGNNLRAITDESGRFSIGAKVGDLLVLTSFSYQPDTLLLTDMHSKEIFMEPQKTMLNEVTITDSSGRSSAADKNMRYYDPQFHGQTMVYHRDKDGNYDGGVILRLHYFTGDDHKKKIAQQKEENRILSDEISAIFTADNISHYVPLKGADLDNFLLLYTPEIKTYNSKDFNLSGYLNTCYKNWLTLTPEQRKAGQLFKKE
jgi:hypothetical protein